MFIAVIGSRKEPCVTEACRTREKIARTVSVICILVVIFYWIRRLCSYCFDGRPPQENTDFVGGCDQENPDYLMNPFTTGVWSFQYYQYRKWRGPFRVEISFNHSIAVGKGTDDVGDFTLDGTFSWTSKRLALTQTYVKGTGDPKENLGHQSIIQLEWNADTNQFEGMWYVRTHKYRGSGKFQLKLGENLTSLHYSDSAC